jgi:hypothetical protein
LFSDFVEEKTWEIIKKNMAFLLVWDKDSYIGRFFVLFPCTCVLQTKLVHLYQISSLLPSPLPIVDSASLKLLYSFLYSDHINPKVYLVFRWNQASINIKVILRGKQPAVHRCGWAGELKLTVSLVRNEFGTRFLTMW